MRAPVKMWMDASFDCCEPSTYTSCELREMFSSMFLFSVADLITTFYTDINCGDSSQDADSVTLSKNGADNLGKWQWHAHIHQRTS